MTNDLPTMRNGTGLPPLAEHNRRVQAALRLRGLLISIPWYRQRERESGFRVWETLQASGYMAFWTPNSQASSTPATEWEPLMPRVLDRP